MISSVIICVGSIKYIRANAEVIITLLGLYLCTVRYKLLQNEKNHFVGEVISVCKSRSRINDGNIWPTASSANSASRITTPDLCTLILVHPLGSPWPGLNCRLVSTSVSQGATGVGIPVNRGKWSSVTIDIFILPAASCKPNISRTVDFNALSR